uniref:HTH La-type RNA-binding domain-containing protein n=1 Tax=Ananas comosus var. bracteatus TaxID=296719 RepID=A0A6V7Q769_ANACO|nr:unnamed protein product [Ananas comosus var. bracteatus]
MFDHRHRIPPFGANFAAPFPPLDPFGAPFNPEASGYSNNFPINNLETPPTPVNSEPVQKYVIVIDGEVKIVDHPELLRKLRRQVEYYFSDENLVDDWYLKSIMDSEGWVTVREIAEFRKVKQLTKNLDVFQLLREALVTSNHVEIQLQEDKMRKSVVVHDPPDQAIPAPGQ